MGGLQGVAVEGWTGEHAARVTGILLSPHRAATLKIINQRAAADPDRPVLIAPPQELTPALARAIADPTLDLSHPLKGPFAARPLERGEDAVAFTELTRRAGLLPAVLLTEGLEPAAATEPAAVAALAAPSALSIAARAPLPTRHGEAEIIAFRSADDPSDHVALVLGARDQSVPLVRLHSECLTGDVLGSLKCDCGPQLDDALARIAAEPWGVLLYLRQEGRGIGLVNKLRAYELQAQGFDTVDANTRLGFAPDARDFKVAARMLQLLVVAELRLLTNNPDKVAGLEAAGLRITERVPLRTAGNPHNQTYLATKRDRAGHLL